MDLQQNISDIIAGSENETVEFKAVLPPSRSIGQILCAFANTKGGFLVLGVNEAHGRQVTGLSKDFHATAVTRKAIDLLSPQPTVVHQHVSYGGKSLYVIRVEKSASTVTIEGKTFQRKGDRIVEVGQAFREFRSNNYPRIEEFSKKLGASKRTATGAKSKFIEHFQSVLKIVDDMAVNLYPTAPSEPTNNQEGKILVRILFSSCADTFESYLSDLLYEIYLANPNTLKSNEQVSIQTVLNCSDIEEFVDVWARRKLAKLQRGSVKGFIADNKQISSLSVFDEAQQDEIEKILQIRHLYSHKNGIVDDKFLKYFPGQYELNEEHILAIDAVIDNLECLADAVERIDAAAISQYILATVN
jgi:hypothetical protein